MTEQKTGIKFSRDADSKSMTHGGAIMRRENDFQSWKAEQITYFETYLRHFRKDSEEYSIIERGIAELRCGI